MACFFYIVLTPISTTSGIWSTGNTHKYQQIDIYIYQCVHCVDDHYTHSTIPLWPPTPILLLYSDLQHVKVIALLLLLHSDLHCVDDNYTHSTITLWPSTRWRSLHPFYHNTLTFNMLEVITHILQLHSDPHYVEGHHTHSTIIL